MTKKDFIELFIEKLEVANKIVTLETRLDSLDEWDSWNRLTLMGLVDENFQVNLTSKDLDEIITIDDLIKKIGEQKFE